MARGPAAIILRDRRPPPLSNQGTSRLSRRRPSPRRLQAKLEIDIQLPAPRTARGHFVTLPSAIAVLEVYLFAFLGRLVDWLSAANRSIFWQDHGLRLSMMAGLILVVLPLLKFCYEAVYHQGLLGNFAMRIRWQAHRYVLR